MLVPVPAALAAVARDALVTTLPGGPYLLPAALHPLVLVIRRGGLTVLRDGSAEAVAPVSLCGGTRAFQTVTAAPGTEMLTLALRPGGAEAMFGPAAVDFMDRIVPIGDLLPDRCRSALDGLAETGDLSLLPGIGRSIAVPPVPPRWLDLPQRELASRFGLGVRQFERRFSAAYGQPLRGYRRQARVSRAILGFIAGRAAPPGGWAEVAAAAGFSDQAHLTRDFRRFTGHTPGALVRGLAEGAADFWPYRIAAGLMTRAFGPTGY